MPLRPAGPPPDWILARRRAVGDRIRELRRWRNLTQKRLGDKAGNDRKAMNRIELGHHSPGLDTLIRIADALDVSLAELVRDVGSPLPPE
ncbi:helix-turn-helix transcriptional regulator [Streptomyces sp. NPDC005970]|uniref:helix-turn-helix domain-containing protein n=1 Tax=Streptomyces sp. NPDC005970 TaxID=3156723 RepID=UPI0033EC2B0E